MSATTADSLPHYVSNHCSNHCRFVFGGMVLKRAISLTILLTTFGILSAVPPRLVAQDLQSQSSPVLPSNILGPELIVWSQLQKPQPLQPATRTLTGTI